jgi:hypothetical protein
MVVIEDHVTEKTIQKQEDSRHGKVAWRWSWLLMLTH